MAVLFRSQSLSRYYNSFKSLSNANIIPPKHKWPICFKRQAVLICPTNFVTNRHYVSLDNDDKNNEEDSVKVDQKIDPSNLIRDPIPFEICMKYMKSTAYKEAYGSDPVWKNYRRNFRGQFVPTNTRRKCIHKGKFITGNPCPICRDEYLILDYRNIQLIKQFICPFSGKIYDTQITSICQQQHKRLHVAVMKAKDYGYIEFDVPFRTYNYSDYYSFPPSEKME